ncbi:MAG: T9SS type A sorting domain-containing protein, partial [candidate division Zixibacteria bacterium]|nr:T9SS type A sorting domain-containing protein [candidate division Zixibacteria bacterium]
ILNLERTFLFDSKGRSVAFRDVVNDTLVLTFASTILGPQDSITLDLRASFLDFISLDGFRIKVPLSEFTFEVTSGALAGSVIEAVPFQGSPPAPELTFSSSLAGLDGVLSTSQNPVAGICFFRFQLDQGNNYKLEIFDLAGQMVWNAEGIAPEQGKSVVWGAENLEGRRVRDGVYIVVLTDLSTGETYKLKQAVLR